MNVGESSEIGHLSCFLGHLLNSLISLLKSRIHSCLSGCHLGFDFLNGLNMTIVLLLLNWLSGHSWLSCKFLLLHLNLLIYGGLSCNQHLLKLSCFLFCLGDSLNMFTISINSRILTLLFLQLGLLISSNLGKFGLPFCFAHLCPWFFSRHKSLSGRSNCCSLVDCLLINLCQRCSSLLRFWLSCLYLLLGSSILFLLSHLSFHLSLSFCLSLCVQINLSSRLSSGLFGGSRSSQHL